MPFITDIEVVYGDDEPHNAVNEISGKSADINKGFGGEYAARYTTQPNEFVSSISTEQHDSAMDGMNDLAKGAGGAFRYLLMDRDRSRNQFVTEIGLWRSDREEWEAPQGWDGKTVDINSNRGGDFLYLVWKTQEYRRPENY